MALCLTRKPGQRVIIGDDVVVEVEEIAHGRARLKITAPDWVRIDREEVRLRIDQENDAA